MKFGSIENIYKVLKKSPKKFEEAGIKEGIIKKLLEGEEDAEFSKQLATIRTDAPIHFELPEKPWRESIHPKQVEDMLSRFEFRSLVPRVRQLVEGINENNVTDVRVAGDELFDEEKEQARSDSKSRSKAKAYSYLSLVGGVAKRHMTWADCEKRVKGKSGVKYKKALSPEDERHILALWGVTIS
jgi:5'-3' exonuclease